jgi:NAD(P)-dependent dehydrogenase (short-subunit alcohol dehydrogenase family)
MNKRRTVLITGASSGIGKATALLFHELNWNVIATMRSPELEYDLKELSHIFVTQLDVTDATSIRAAVEEGVERFGTIDVLVNNAGYGAYGLLEATSTEKIRRQFETNVIGLLEVTKAVLPIFPTRRQGVFINLSSIVGK